MTTATAERCLIATWPCGCIGAVSLLTYATPKEQADFYREHVEDGALVENVTMGDYHARGGFVVCEHEPKWGGAVSKFGVCDECNKRVLLRKDGTVRSHKGRWGMTCNGRPA